MEEKYCQCQSCGMPMGDTQELYGAEIDGTKNKEYCSYCYENGGFTSNATMEEMIEICIPHMASANISMSEDEARNMMKQFFPMLKRWKSN